MTEGRYVLTADMILAMAELRYAQKKAAKTERIDAVK